MDVNQNEFTNHTWSLEMSLENQIPHDQNPFSSSLWPGYTLQWQTPSSSIKIPISSSSLPGDYVRNHKEEEDEPEEELGAVKEMMYKMAAMQPVDIDPATIHKPKRRNVRISEDPQSVAARHRRERISEKMRILQRLVPGGTKMDTASMLDEAIRYVKFLKRQIRLLQSSQHQPCTGDWLVAYTRPLDPTINSSTLDIPPGGPTYTSSGGNGFEALISSNYEVIND